MNLPDLLARFSDVGCRQLYVKFLARNDNSKQQIYFGPNFQALNLFPAKEIKAEIRPEGKMPILKAALDFGWLMPNGQVAPAPNAKFILYPQYPEIRFSGFLLGAHGAPSVLLNAPREGRIFFIGITGDRRLVGYVADANTPIASEFCEKYAPSDDALFIPVAIPRGVEAEGGRRLLVDELARIHRLSWIDSKQLGSSGEFAPCNAPQCGGYTLEAELGVSKNGKSEPDFHGWEIKQHSVLNFDRPENGDSLTLMTPEPTGGLYRELGVEGFVRRFGYDDKRGRSDRMNFGGVHKYGIQDKNTKLTLGLDGFDIASSKLTDASGSLVLRSDSGEIAASWAFESLLTHWSRKHANAAYVPSKMRKEPQLQYAYGSKVRLGCGTDPLRLLKGISSGLVYYDPGIKLEGVSTKTPKSKRRSQFRIKSKDLRVLYERMDVVDVSSST